MKSYLLVLAALSVLLAGCGNDETPKVKQAGADKAMQESPATMTEKPAPAEPMAESMPAAEAPVGAAEKTMPAQETETTAGMTEATPTTGMTMADSGEDQGKQIYGSVCFACHAMGVAGAPKLGDKMAWAPRIAQGMDTLYSHAINGFQGSSGVMPAKGGRTDLADADIRAAVSYMVDQAK